MKLYALPLGTHTTHNYQIAPGLLGQDLPFNIEDGVMGSVEDLICQSEEYPVH